MRSYPKIVNGNPVVIDTQGIAFLPTTVAARRPIYPQAANRDAL